MAIVLVKDTFMYSYFSEIESYTGGLLSIIARQVIGSDKFFIFKFCLIKASFKLIYEGVSKQLFVSKADKFTNS